MPFRPLVASVLLLGAAALPAQVPPDVTLEALPGVSGLGGALGLAHAGDSSGRRFVVQQNGTVRVIAADDSLLATPFIDIGPLLTSGGERGLLDLAFHPEHAVAGAPGEGLFYLHFSSAGPDQVAGTERGDTVVAEFRVGADPNVADPEVERVILTVAQDFANHNGGQMKFGPDGYLYLALGDGGSANDPCDRAQTLDPAAIVTGSGCESDRSVALLGKMLRIDVDATTPPGANNLCGAAPDGSAEYAVPDVNPFSGRADRCGEVLLYGLRNPWRFSFDRETQDLWIGDVGQNTWEEIDRLGWPLGGGDDLGWRVCEGSRARGSTSTACPLAGSVLPVLEYRTGVDGNRSVTGGYRYRGPVASLRGRYIFGDFSSGRIWFARTVPGGWQRDEFGSGFGNVRSFGEDEAGNVYVIAGGTVYRFEGLLDLIFANGFEPTTAR
jgi:hypothetical protein